MPTGKVAIETLREGDLMVARNEETGASGTFPITAVLARQANDLLWLHLEREDGATSRMGVTTGHPMFVAGQGWIAAGELIPGDIIRNADLRDLAVLAIVVDDTPQRVHNLEIGEAHTYFVGDLEAWGHNAGTSKVPTIPKSERAKPRCAKPSLKKLVIEAFPTCVYCNKSPSTQADHVVSHSHGGGSGDISDFAGACDCCNNDKSNLTLWEMLGRPSVRNRK